MESKDPLPITVQITSEDAGCRLDRWFKRHYPAINHGLLEKTLRKGHIRLNSTKAASNTRVEEGQTLSIPAYIIMLSEVPLPMASVHVTDKQRQSLLNAVLYKDDDIIVLNKPAGLAVQGGSKVTISLDDMLDGLCFEKNERPKLVHRLDKDTSGVLLLARTVKAAAALTQAFRHKDIQKTYWAAVAGNPSQAEGKIDIPLAKTAGAKGYELVREGTSQDERALTYYRVVESIPGILSWLELKPITGRTHQLRVHCLSLGTPVVGDGKYGGKAAFIAGISPKLHLHAREIILPDLFGKECRFTAPLPPHMQTSWEMFGFKAGSLK